MSDELYYHASEILDGMREAEKVRASTVNRLIDEVVAAIGNSLLTRCSLESGMSTFSSEEQKIDFTKRIFNCPIPTFEGGLEVINEAIKVAKLEREDYTELALKKDVMRHIARLMSWIYTNEYDYNIPRAESPRKVSLPEIAGCMSLVEEKLGIKCSLAIANDFIRYIEEQVKNPSRERPRYLV